MLESSTKTYFDLHEENKQLLTRVIFPGNMVNSVVYLSITFFCLILNLGGSRFYDKMALTFTLIKHHKIKMYFQKEVWQFYTSSKMGLYFTKAAFGSPCNYIDH